MSLMAGKNARAAELRNQDSSYRASPFEYVETAVSGQDTMRVGTTYKIATQTLIRSRVKSGEQSALLPDRKKS